MSTEMHLGRVIGGKLYTTETAEVMVETRMSYSNMDKGHPLILYRTRKGNFFLVEYRAYVDTGEPSPGEFTVLTLEEARAWVEKWANEKYERVFGLPEEA